MVYCLVLLCVSYVSGFVDVLVKEKRWVMFRGERDPTSIPGKCSHIFD